CSSDVCSSDLRYLDLGCVILCRCHIWLYLRSFGSIALWSVGRIDDSLHLSFWPTLSQTGAQCAHFGRADSRPSRIVQPTHSCRLQPSGEHHQFDGELHGGGRTCFGAFSAALSGRRDNCGGWCSELHPVVWLPRISFD